MKMELAILDFLQTLHNPVLDWLMCGISALGNHGAVWIFLGILLLASKKYRKEGLGVLLVLLGCLLAGNVLLKNLVARPRPCWLRPDVPLLIPVPQDFSFPSGHTMAAAAVSCYLWLGNRKWGTVSFAVTCLMAFSRMYLYVHYPTDILGGFAAGMLLGWLVRKAESLYGKKTGKETM